MRQANVQTPVQLTRQPTARRSARGRLLIAALAAVLGFLAPGCGERHGDLSAEEQRAPRATEPAQAASSTASAAAATGLAPLGSAPLCEPSAAIRAPWDASRVIVADNEVDDALFELELRPDGLLEVRGTLPMPSKRRPHDIEALTALSDGALLVVGSHSRNKSCEVKKNRQRLRVLARAEATGALEEVAAIDHEVHAQALADPARCLETWFEPGTAGAEGVCTALAEAEAADGCGALNIEGAMLLPGGHLWLGLRAPLRERRALALRIPEAQLRGGAALRTDAVVELELGGLAVRELLHDGDTVWILAGASHDADTPHELWRLPVDTWAAATSGAVLEPERVATVPNAAESLVLDGQAAIVILDGAQGRAECKQPAQQTRVPLTR